MSTKGILCCLAALGAVLLLAAPAAALPAADEGQREAAEDRLEDLIKRLEVGMSALEELGCRDALEIMRNIANDLRGELAHERRGESDEVRTVRRRLEVMRTAVEAFIEAGRHDAAELVEHAMHSRELIIEGRRDEEAMRIRETAPNRGQLAEALGAAAGLYREWGMPDRAEALADLAETYAKQWKRQQRAEREGRVTERERERGEGLDSLAARIEIIRYSRDAFAKAGDENNVKVLEGVIHYGELALEGASEEMLAKAAEAVPSMPNLVEYMSWAAHKYAEWGWEKRSAECRKLAEYYARQVRAGQESARREREDAGRQEADERRIRKLEDEIHRLSRQIEELTRTLRELQQDR